jgi:carboxyl-terminal processing protease
MTDNTEPKFKNSKLAIIAPLILAFVLAGGIFIGKSLSVDEGTTSLVFKSDPNKLDFILDVVEKEYVDTVLKHDLIEKTIPVILEHLDPHSVYIPARDLKEVSEPLEGNFEGIGVQFNIMNDTVLVINTISGGPAEKVGVLAGDKIVTINDSLFSGTGISNDQVIKKLKGKGGTTVTVGVARVGYPELLSFEITRDKIPLYSVDVSYMINKTTGYIKISTFARTTYDEFVQALSKLKGMGMKELVLDLRSNTGGYLDAAIKVADEFLSDQQLIVYTEGKERPRADYLATPDGRFEEGNLAVLIDSWSASASEIVAGAIQDNDRGTIIGRRSFGKGLVQETTYFRDGSAMRLTIARYYTPTGRSIQKPYDNGVKDYEHELISRYEHGEFETVDSTVFNEENKFVTKGGKTVYGGGGIMPDIFVPIDTTGQTPFYRQVSRKAMIYNYALRYTNQNRETLSKFNNYKEIVNLLENRNVFAGFLQEVRNGGLNPKITEISQSEQLIKTYLYAYICRNIINNDGYFPVLQKVDNVLLKAVDELSN